MTPRSLNVKLGPRRNYHKGRAAIRHYANQTALLRDYEPSDGTFSSTGGHPSTKVAAREGLHIINIYSCVERGEGELGPGTWGHSLFILCFALHQS